MKVRICLILSIWMGHAVTLEFPFASDAFLLPDSGEGKIFLDNHVYTQTFYWRRECLEMQAKLERRLQISNKVFSSRSTGFHESNFQDLLRLIQADIVCGHIVPGMKDVIGDLILGIPHNFKRFPMPMNDQGNQPEHSSSSHHEDEASYSMTGRAFSFVKWAGVQTSTSILKYAKDQTEAVVDKLLMGYLNKEATRSCYENIMSVIQEKLPMNDLEASLGLTGLASIDVDLKAGKIVIRICNAWQLLSSIYHISLLIRLKDICPSRTLILFPYRDLVIGQYEKWITSIKEKDPTFPRGRTNQVQRKAIPKYVRHGVHLQSGGTHNMNPHSPTKQQTSPMSNSDNLPLSSSLDSRDEQNSFHFDNDIIIDNHQENINCIQNGPNAPIIKPEESPLGPSTNFSATNSHISPSPSNSSHHNAHPLDQSKSLETFTNQTNPTNEAHRNPRSDYVIFSISFMTIILTSMLILILTNRQRIQENIAVSGATLKSFYIL